MRRGLIALIVLFGCSGKPTPEEKGNYVTLKGKVGFPQSGVITVKELRPDTEKVFQDTIQLKGDYTFSKRLPVPTPGYYQVSFYDKQFVNLILDKGEVELNVDGNDPSGFSEIKGSRDLDLITAYQKQVKSAQETPEMRTIEDEFQLAATAGDEEKVQQLQEKYMGMLNATYDKIADQIRKEPASLGILDFLVNGRVLDQDKYFDLFPITAEKVKAAWPDNYFVKEFVSMTEKLKVTAVGQLAPEIALPNPDGKIISLSSLRGKYILVDFWAMWCGPCRRENPNVVKAYKAFKGKSFDILGVSLDRTREDWLKAIKDDGLVWNHVSDLKYFESKAALDYNITGIPFSVLVDPKGVIIAKNLRGGELHRKLAEVLK